MVHNNYSNKHNNRNTRVQDIMAYPSDKTEVVVVDSLDSDKIIYDELETKASDDELETKEETKELEDLQFVMVTNCKKVNFRKTPKKGESNILFEPSIGTEFVLLDEDADWYYVQSLETPSTYGYIMKQFAKKVEK